MTWNHMPPPFGQLLQQYLDDRDWSQRHFAELVGSSHTTVRRIVEGERTPAPEELEQWADRLGIDGEARSLFVLAGRSARAKGKADSSDYIKGLEAQVAKLTQRVEGAERRMTEAIGTLTMASALLDQTLALLKQRGVEVPQSVTKAATSVRDKVSALG